MECECVAPAYPFVCPRHDRQMNAETHALCAGCFRPPVPRETYVKHWQAERLGLRRRSPPLSAEAPMAIPRSPVREPLPESFVAGPTSLTIGMAVCEDYDGWYFSTQDIRLQHPEVADRLSFLVVDNRPDGAEGTAIRQKIRGVDGEGNIRETDGTGWIPRARYIAMPEIQGTSAVRDRIFKEATTDAVLVIDAHVLLEKGSLARLLRWFDDNPDSPDLIHGPMLDDFLPHVHATHMVPEWGSDLMFGRWAVDSDLTRIDAPVKEIPMHGLGLFACRRDAWPGFPPHLKGFGGEEGNIHEAFRQRGGRVLCHPGVRWLHRFDRPRFADRPASAPYDCLLQDKLWNYLVWARWLDRPHDVIVDQFHSKLSQRAVGKIVQAVGELDVGRLQPPARRSADTPDSAPCIHRGEYLYDRRCAPCKSPTGGVFYVPVFTCSKHRRCTAISTGLHIKGCPSCVDRMPPSEQGVVSVLVVTHGRFQHVRELLQCFLHQDHPSRELLILNHHPTPLTLGIEPPAGVRVEIFNEPNEDLFAANLARLLPHARGEFLSTWGDDDYYLPWCLSMAAAAIGDRMAWKPARSWYYDGVRNQVDQVANTLEPSILWRTSFVREHGFDAGDTEAGALLRALNGPVPSTEVGSMASFLTTWGTGVFHLSGSIGVGTAEERHARWRQHNQDDGGGAPLTPADVRPRFARLEPHIPEADRAEWRRKVGL